MPDPVIPVRLGPRAQALLVVEDPDVMEGYGLTRARSTFSTTRAQWARVAAFFRDQAEGPGWDLDRGARAAAWRAANNIERALA